MDLKRWCLNTLQSLVEANQQTFSLKWPAYVFLNGNTGDQTATWKLLISAKKKNPRLLRKNMYLSIFFLNLFSVYHRPLKKMNTLFLKAKSLWVTDFQVSRGKRISRVNWPYTRNLQSKNLSITAVGSWGFCAKEVQQKTLA